MLIYSVYFIKSVILIREWITLNSLVNLRKDKAQSHGYWKDTEALRPWNLEPFVPSLSSSDGEMQAGTLARSGNPSKIICLSDRIKE